jgi:hypothetical protein
MSETSDSLSSNQNIIKRNQISISVNGMNDLIGNENLHNSIALSYKRRFNNYALRFGFFSDEKLTDTQIGRLSKLNDTAYILTSTNMTNYKKGFNIGLEKSTLIINKITFFYGAELNFLYLEDLTITSSSYFRTQVSNEYLNYSHGGNGKSNYGYGLGLKPIIGINQNITNHISTSIELGILAYYTSFNNHTSRLSFDEKLKLNLNINF